MDGEFDSEFMKLVACNERRMAKDGVCDDTTSCDIGWCAGCRQAISARKAEQEAARLSRKEALSLHQGHAGDHARKQKLATRGARTR